MQENCIRGHWEGDICVCEKGYKTVFTDEALHPSYCSEAVVVVVGNEVYDGENLFHLILMAATIIVMVCSFIALASLVYATVDAIWTHCKMRQERQNLLLFESRMLKRESPLMAELWSPPPQFYCINQEQGEQQLMLQAKVLHPYKPQDKDELHLRTGDIITEVVQLQEGWCKGKIDGKTGFFPVAFVEITDAQNRESDSASVPAEVQPNRSITDAAGSTISQAV